MSFAKEENLCLIADPTSVVLAEKLRPHLSNLYMMTPNISEAEVFTEQKITSRQEATAAAHKLVAAGLNLVIITLAENGVVYATPDTSGYIPALTTKIVDLTGASDAMTATIMFGLLHEMPLDEAVRLGANAAAWTIRSEESVVEDLTADMLYDW
jgi:pseudouridine kinase